MKQDPKFKSNDWALVLGASSGFGGATAIELAKMGVNIFGVHLDPATAFCADCGKWVGLCADDQRIDGYGTRLGDETENE